MDTFLLVRSHYVRSFATTLAMLAALIYPNHGSLRAPHISHHLVHLRRSTYKFFIFF
jgi:hypothetical protein